MQKIYNILKRSKLLLVLLFLLLTTFSFSQNNINRVEYFFDTDPGFGNAISIPITANNDIQNQLHSIDISAVSNGFHNFFIRSRDDSGSWSLTINYPIFRASLGSSNNAAIAKAEYFFDTDPGFGNATPITLTANNNIQDVVLPIDISTITNGFHQFFMRSQDVNGVWSLTNMQAIFKTGSNAALGNITACEYFFDTDPGFGNATPISFTPSTNVADQILTINIQPLTNGFHSLFIRSKDVNGNWSITNQSPIFKTSSGSAIANITKVEYFIDTDPGFGNGTDIPVTQALNINNQTYSFTKPSTLTEGNHNLFVRAQDANGTWSITNTISFYHVIKKVGSGYCLNLNGSNQYASIPHNANLNCNNQLTLEAWIYPTAYNSQFPTVIAKNNSGSSYELDLRSDGKIEFEAFIGGAQRSFSGGDISLNKWTHIAATFDGSQMKIYQNGTLVATANYSGTIGSNTTPVTIGARSGGGALFAGKIDEVKIWNTALTQAQLRDRMCSKVKLNDALISNLMCYLNCDEVSANSLYDLTDSLNHASLINTPTKVVSGAAIGDTSAYVYVTSGLPNKLLSFNSQDSININYTSGTYSGEGGVHIYAVNGKPNSNTGLGGIALNNDRYFGVFSANINSPSYTANYYYSSNPFATGIAPNELGLFKRNDNSVTTWTNSNANLNNNNNSLEVAGQSTEYILSNCAVAVVPTVTVSRTLPNICDVTVANFSASITDGGSSPQYQWKLNGNNVGTNANTYSHSALGNNDSVWCMLTSNASCVNTPVVSSNKVVTIYPTITTQNINVFGCFTATYNAQNYTASTSFIDTVKTAQGCDSIYKNVSITVYTTAATYDTVRVYGCNSVIYNSVTYTSSTAYTDTVRTVAGCDNVYRRIIITVYNITPTIQNNTVYGCGSAVFNGNTYTTNVLVKDTLKAVSNCDSIYIHTQIVIINPTTQNINYLGCGSYTYNSVVYNNSTSFIDTVKSQIGCDSVYKNIAITVIHSTTNNISLSGCNSVVYNSVTYTSSTIKRDTILSSLGCDSVYNVATISITTVTPISQTINYTGCNSYVYNSVTYNNSTTLHDTLHSYQGCDSVHRTINITVHHRTPTTNTVNVNGCNSVTHNSITYSSSTILRDTLRDVNGCDSIYNITNINVTIVNATSQTINVAGCDSAVYNSIKYFASTILHDTLYSYQGCDSVYRTINITVQPKPTITVTASINPVCSTNPTTLTASGGGNYTWTPSTALSSTSGAVVTASPANSITYTVTSNQTCVVSKTITITTKPLPTVDAGANQSILQGSSTTLTATGAVSYVWSTGDTTATINVAPTSNTNYIVTGTAANGCTAQDLVSVAVNFSSLAVNTNNYNFGNVVVNYAGTTNIVVTNNGTLPVTLNGVSVASPYTATLASQTLQPNASVSIPVSFAPTATLFYMQSLTISTSIGNMVVNLQGRGVAANPSWVITPSNKAFGNVLVNDSATQTFVLFNTGNVPVNVSSISSSNALFTGVSSANTIAVGGNATITVKFKPTTIGVQNATVFVNSSTVGLSATSVAVNGSGYINNTPPTLNFVNAAPYNGTKGVDKAVSVAGLYTYNIVYKSSTNTAPQAGYPKVGIDVNGDGDFIDVDEGIYSMSQVNATSDWATGEEFTFSTNLAVGNTYSYQFFANDSLGNPATTVNTARYNGPIVSDQTLDLSIFANDIQFSVAHPSVGQTFTVFATIHNNTPYSANNVYIRYYTDSLFYGDTIIPYIAPNSNTTISKNFVYNLDGFYPIKVWIDSANVLGETNVLNNYASRPIIVGNFTVPGAIIVNATAREQHCPDAMVVSGNAYYTGLNLQGTPPVLGAYVEVWENGNVIGSTYTTTEGVYTVYIPHSCGSGNYEVTVTDYTLTGNSGTKPYSIACGVSCGSYYNPDYTPNYYGYGSSMPCCVIANASFTNTYNFKNNNTYKYTNDTILVYADDTLRYTYTRDSISAGQTVSYNSTFNFGVGSHTIKYYSYHHYNYQTISIDTTGGGMSIVVVTHIGRIVDSTIANVVIDTPKADLALSEFTQTAIRSISVKVGNGTCINAGASKLYIYEGNSSFGSLVLLDSVATTAVSAGKCGDSRVLLNYTKANWALGYHYLVLKADGENAVDELNENNNTLNAVIYVPYPDVSISNIQSSNSDVHNGDVINFSATVTNNGSAANNFKVQFSVDGVNVGTSQTIVSLPANSSTTVVSNNYTVGANNCPIKVVAFVDANNDLFELNENDNKDSIQFGSDIVSGASCYSVGSSCNPYVVYVGSTLTMNAPVSNIGLRDVDIVGVRFNLSGNIIGTDNINHLAAQSASNVALTHTFNTVGSYVIEVESDYNNEYCEKDEANNLGYIYVNVTSALPDLQVYSHFINPSNLNPNPGQAVTVATTVKNAGTAASQPSYVRFWVDNVQLGNDVPLNSIKVGRDTAVAATATYTGTSVGPKIIKVTVHYGEATGFEQTFANNEATRSIIVGAAPDFARTINEGITFNRPKYRIGKAITIKNYIRNYGGDNGTAWLKFYYRDTFGVKTLIDSVQFSINHHDSARISKRWTVAGYGRIITEISSSNPPEFNLLNNVDSIDLVIDTTTPTVTITPNLSNVCEGTNITFTASSTNVVTPLYVWMFNGVLTGDTATTYSHIMNIGDYVSCRLLDEEQYLIISSNTAPTLRLRTYSTTSITRCSNQLPLVWNGISYNTAGTYTKAFVNSVGCDSIVTLVLTVLQASSSTTRDSIYTGNTYTFNGNTYSAAGTYTVHLTNSVGCDSSAILILTLRTTGNGGAITGVFKSCILGSNVNRIYAPTGGGTWNSSDTTIATIDKYGYVTAKTNGTVTFSYMYIINGVTYISTVNYLVDAVPTPAAISGVNSLCLGSTATYTCSTPNGIWSHTTNRIVITNAGVATAINAGNTDQVVYTVTSTSGCSASSYMPVTVNSLPAIPNINYAPGTSSPQTTSSNGVLQICTNRTFTLVGNPAGGVWTTPGIINITPSNIPVVNGSVIVSSTTVTGYTNIKYEVTNAYGCKSSRVINGNVIACASKGLALTVDTRSLAIDFTLYPNPVANGMLQIVANNLVGSNNQIIITNVLGKIVKQHTLSLGTNKVDVSNLLKGTYFVSMITNDGKRETQKLVIE